MSPVQIDDGALIAVATTCYTALSGAVVALWRHGIKERSQCREELTRVWEALANLRGRPISGRRSKLP